MVWFEMLYLDCLGKVILFFFIDSYCLAAIIDPNFLKDPLNVVYMVNWTQIAMAKQN